jgi:hypothetical protein
MHRSRLLSLVSLLLPAAGAVHAAVLQVGPGRDLSVPSAAAAIAQDGDVIEIDAGLYQDDIVVWRANNLTLRGMGGRAHLQATVQIPYIPGNDQANGKAIWVIKGSDTVVENIEFSGASVPDQNGAGIRAEGSGLTVRNCYFHDNEDGILGGSGTVTIEHSEFAYNGYGDGQTHNLYISNIDELIFRYNYSHHARIGHNLKSRARVNRIYYNRIMDEADGTSSYAIDLPNGGLSFIVGNLIQQGADTDNSTIVSYGAEGLSNSVAELYFAHNTVVNDRHAGQFVYARSGASAWLVNNLFVGPGTVLNGAGTLQGNIVQADRSLAYLYDVAAYNYRPRILSPAVDSSVDANSVNGYDLRPSEQYQHPLDAQARTAIGAADAGAYEYRPGDIDGDGELNSRDIGILMSRWLGNDVDADLSGDGQVTAEDLILLLANRP